MVVPGGKGHCTTRKKKKIVKKGKVLQKIDCRPFAANRQTKQK